MALRKIEFDQVWLDEVGELSQYGDRQIVVRDCEDINNLDPKTFPNFFTLVITKKNAGLVNDIPLNSKLKVTTYLCGYKGVSKTNGKPYRFNKLNVASIEVLERPAISAEENEVDEGKDDADEELPF